MTDYLPDCVFHVHKEHVLFKCNSVFNILMRAVECDILRSIIHIIRLLDNTFKMLNWNQYSIYIYRYIHRTKNTIKIL